MYGAWRAIIVGRTRTSMAPPMRSPKKSAIHKTMCHVLWADQTWISRFSNSPPPVPLADLAALHRDWASLKARRIDFDADIVRWADSLAPDWLAGTHTYFSPSLGRETSG